MRPSASSWMNSLGTQCAARLVAQDWRPRRSVKPSSYGIQMSLTCRLTCSELVFDNRRDGERACGNQVDADGAAWAVRGSRDSWARRSRTETRGPTEYPRAECLR